MIGEAIGALATQDPAPDEIVVVDDGSSDNSLGQLAILAQRIPSLRIVALPQNVGVINALNRGLAEVRGEFIYFGAADDLVLPGLFGALLPLLENNPTIAFASAEGIVFDIETRQHSFRPPIRPAHVDKVFSPAAAAELFRHVDNWILTGAAIVRCSMLRQAGGFDANLSGSADACLLRQLAFKHGAAFSPHVGMIWRISTNGVSRLQAADADKNLAVLDWALKSLAKDPAIAPWYIPLFERRWRFSVGRLAAQSRPMNLAILERVAARGSTGRSVLRLAAHVGGPIGRVMAISWLVARERPMSLFRLVDTVLKRQRNVTFPVKNVPLS